MLKFCNLLNAKMTEPKAFGLFHLIVVLIILSFVILFTVLMLKSKNKNKWTYYILLISWIILVIIEVFKQLYGGINLDGKGGWYWKYEAPHLFPFVLCSMPLYFIPLYLFIPKQKFRTIILDFITVYCLYGGGFVLLVYPGDVFTTSTLLNYHTSIFHGIMLFLGLLFLFTGVTKFSGKTVLNAFIIFVILWAIAGLGNEILWQVKEAKKLTWIPNLLNISHRLRNSFAEVVASLTKGKVVITPKVLYLCYPLYTFLVSNIFFVIFGLIGYGINKGVVNSDKLYQKSLVKKASKRRELVNYNYVE